jgi:hypothetical protein
VVEGGHDGGAVVKAKHAEEAGARGRRGLSGRAWSILVVITGEEDLIVEGREQRGNHPVAATFFFGLSMGYRLVSTYFKGNPELLYMT